MRRLIASISVLFIVAVLTIPVGRSVKATAITVPDFCTDCAQNCWNEANTGDMNDAYWQCRDSGHTQAYCDNLAIQYYNACIATDCNYAGCTIAPKSYRLCKTGDCY